MVQSRSMHLVDAARQDRLGDASPELAESEESGSVFARVAHRLVADLDAVEERVEQRQRQPALPKLRGPEGFGFRV